MPDWEKLVAERLGHIKLPPEERREVIAEITAHLEECYQALRDAGSPDPEGYTLAQVRDWNALRRKIRRAKEGPMSFARKVMFPGLGALALEQIALSLAVSALPWMATLALAGLLAAGLARRMGASPTLRLIAAVFPALYHAAEFVVFGYVFSFYPRIALYWLIIPAIICAIGALPFLSNRTDQVAHA